MATCIRCLILSALLGANAPFAFGLGGTFASPPPSAGSAQWVRPNHPRALNEAERTHRLKMSTPPTVHPARAWFKRMTLGMLVYSASLALLLLGVILIGVARHWRCRRWIRYAAISAFPAAVAAWFATEAVLNQLTHGHAVFIAVAASWWIALAAWVGFFLVGVGVHALVKRAAATEHNHCE
ncbi:MAG: hypothetical protein AAF493_15810 [Pseudomonadota bacterium]